MSPIIPAIIPDSFESLKSTLGRLSFVKGVQVDIVDGQFVPFTSWPYQGEGKLEELGEIAEAFEIELDLMIMAPEEALDACARAGIRRVVIHLESTDSLERILDHHASHTYELGFSILNDTPLDTLTPYISAIDYVQLMGIKDIGSQGQPFDERVIERIRTLRHMYPDLPISIDGSVNRSSISKLAEAGATRFISGSAILKASDPEAVFREFESLVSPQISG